MQTETHAVTRLRMPPRIDPRVVFSAYAAGAIMVGMTVAGTGIRGIPGMPQEYASIVWIAGAAIVAAGCAAWGLALNDDPVGGLRAMRWFAAGHLLFGLMVWFQWAVYWRGHGIPLLVALAPLAIGIVLLALANPGGLVGGEEAAVATERRIRSAYSEHILQIARREERARLARDLHDAVKQQLFVIQTAAATAEARFDDDLAGAREALTQVRTAARDASTEMAALLDELQAAPMENTGLVEALKKQCDALALRTGAAVNFTSATMPPAGALRPGAYDAIYRVAQEALANVARHARARRVDVSVQSSPTQFELRIMDDGTGFNAEAARSGMGLMNMNTRAAEIGGRLSLVSRSVGTGVVLTVPLTNAELHKAWFTAALFALLAVSNVVFYSLRGNSPDRRISLAVVGLFGVWAAVRLMVAYLKVWKVRSR